MSEKRYVRMPRKAFLSLMRLAWQNAGQTASGNYKWVDDTGTQKPRYTKSDKPPQSRGEKQQQQATAKAERQKQKEAARQAKEQEKAAKLPEAKKAQAQEAIQNAIENGVQGEQVLALVDALLSVRVKDLKEIRASLGAKGGKTKSEITQKISAKIVEKALGEQKPKGVVHADVVEKLKSIKQEVEAVKDSVEDIVDLPPGDPRLTQAKQKIKEMMKDMSNEDAVAIAKAIGVPHNVRGRKDATKHIIDKVFEREIAARKIRY